MPRPFVAKSPFGKLRYITLSHAKLPFPKTLAFGDFKRGTMATKGLGYSTPKFPVLRAGGLLNELHSDTLKKAVAVSEEKIQERSRRRGRFSSSHFPCQKKKNLNLGRDRIRAAGNR